MSLRIGHGYDMHQMKHNPQKGLVMGGVRIYQGYQIVGHSDGDVVVHAVADALLGAANMSNIGQHFPASQTKPGFDSCKLMLTRITHWFEQQRIQVQNIDVTILAQKPRLASHTDNMAFNIASSLQINTNQVSVKATTTDHLGAIGRIEGIATEAVALIQV